MALTARNARLVAIVIGTAAAGAIAPAAPASPEGSSPPREQLYVNPSTGYATPAPAGAQSVQVNPSTGYASVAERPTSDRVATARPIEPAAATAEPSSGFDWVAAAIGAAAGAALTLLLILSLPSHGVGRLIAPDGSARRPGMAARSRADAPAPSRYELRRAQLCEEF